MFAGSVAGPSVRTASVSGAKAPSPKLRTSVSYDARDATLSGRIVASGALNRTWRKGVPSTSSTASVGKKTRRGCRMTRRASRAQAPSDPGSGRTFRIANASTRDPRTERSPSRTVSPEKNTARPAVATVTRTAGRAVFFSGLTVLLGLLGLVLFEFMILRSVGIAGALVVGIAVAAALTLQPALLSVLGSRVDALAIRKVRPDPGSQGAWARLARRVMRRPLLVFFPTLGLLLVLGTPFLHVRFNAPDATILPESVPSRASYETLVRNFGEGTLSG